MSYKNKNFIPSVVEKQQHMAVNANVDDTLKIAFKTTQFCLKSILTR
jgi:hypothetical protein